MLVGTSSTPWYLQEMGPRASMPLTLPTSLHHQLGQGVFKYRSDRLRHTDWWLDLRLNFRKRTTSLFP